jgi:hypothetical protein
MINRQKIDKFEQIHIRRNNHHYSLFEIAQKEASQYDFHYIKLRRKFKRRIEFLFISVANI